MFYLSKVDMACEAYLSARFPMNRFEEQPCLDPSFLYKSAKQASYFLG